MEIEPVSHVLHPSQPDVSASMWPVSRFTPPFDLPSPTSSALSANQRPSNMPMMNRASSRAWRRPSMPRDQAPLARKTPSWRSSVAKSARRRAEAPTGTCLPKPLPGLCIVVYACIYVYYILSISFHNMSIERHYPYYIYAYILFGSVPTTICYESSSVAPTRCVLPR